MVEAAPAAPLSLSGGGDGDVISPMNVMVANDVEQGGGGGGAAPAAAPAPPPTAAESDENAQDRCVPTLTRMFMTSLKLVPVLAFLVLLALQLDRVIDLWGLVFLPLLLSTGLSSAKALLVLKKNIMAPHPDPAALPAVVASSDTVFGAAYRFVNSAAGFGLLVLLCLFLTGVLPSSTPPVLLMLPVFINGVVGVTLLCTQPLPAALAIDEELAHSFYRHRAVSARLHGWLGGLQVLLIACKVEGAYREPWMGVFWPTWLLLLFAGMALLLGSLAMFSLHVRPHMGQDNPPWRRFVRITSLTTVGLWAEYACIVVFLSLVIRKLDKPKPTDAVEMVLPAVLGLLLYPLVAETFRRARNAERAAIGEFAMGAAEEPGGPLRRPVKIEAVKAALLRQQNATLYQLVKYPYIPSAEEAAAAAAASSASSVHSCQSGHHLVDGHTNSSQDLAAHAGGQGGQGGQGQTGGIGLTGVSSSSGGTAGAGGDAEGALSLSSTVGGASIKEGEKEKVEDEDEEGEDGQVLCYICEQNEADAVVMNCGHSGACYECSVMILRGNTGSRRCPICRAAMVTVMKLSSERRVVDGDTLVATTAGLTLQPGWTGTETQTQAVGGAAPVLSEPVLFSDAA